jgi:hypothetical protein
LQRRALEVTSDTVELRRSEDTGNDGETVVHVMRVGVPNTAYRISAPSTAPVMSSAKRTLPAVVAKN